MARIAVVTPMIRPGGGPAGYNYNLRRGLATLRSQGRLNNQFTFVARSSEARVSSGAGSSAVRNSLNRLDRFSLGGLRRSAEWAKSLSSEGQRRRNVLQSCDGIIAQGFQNPAPFERARQRGQFVGYMPHSPTPLYRELQMMARSSAPKERPVRRDIEQAREYEARLFAAADLVVFPSPGAMGQYELEYSDQLADTQVAYAASGVVSPAQDFAATDTTRSELVLFVGRYVEHKGYDLFCEAARIACPMLDDSVAFASIGTGPIQAKRPVHDLGWLEAPHAQIAAASVVVVPNRVAFYDLLPLEAAALGVPLIFTPVGGNVDQARALPDSLLCSELTPESIAAAMCDAVRHKRTTPSWGTGNQRAYAAEFTESAMARRWDDVITGHVSRN